MAEVVLVRWPEEGQEGEQLAREGVAVLYLVNEQDVPPAPSTCLEDWVRLPGNDRDVQARVALLEMRARSHHVAPRIDEDNRMHFRGRVVTLPVGQARLVRVLVAHFGEVVDDDNLSVQVAEEQGLPAVPLQVQIAHLRQRVRDVGLTVRRIRGRGYQLESR